MNAPDNKGGQSELIKKPSKSDPVNNHFVSDREIVQNIAKSFRPGAQIMIEDIRVYARAEGHPIDRINHNTIAKYLSEICEVKEGNYGKHDYHSWVVI